MSALVLALLLGGAPASPAAALNTEGYRLYQAQKYAEAIETFRKAIAADGNHALSHYNLAATLGLMRKQNRVCEFDAYQSTVLDELEQAVKLDEGRRKRAQKDSDFDDVKDTVRWQKLIGLDPARDADVKKLVVALGFWAPSNGALGSPAHFDFKADGTFVADLKEMGEGGEIEPVQLTGTFTVTGRKVTLKLSTARQGKKTLTGTFGVDGALELEGFDRLTDQRSECDA